MKHPFEWKKEKQKEFHRTCIISALSKLCVLNGSKISTIERRDCEIFYLNSCQEAINFHNVKQSELVGYDRLVKEYGKPNISDSTVDSTMKSSIITVTIQYGSEEYEKKIPPGTTTSVQHKFFSLVI